MLSLRSTAAKVPGSAGSEDGKKGSVRGLVNSLYLSLLQNSAGSGIFYQER